MATPKAPAGGFQNGGWYDGMQYWNGSFSPRGQIHSQSNQQGAGQKVSTEVNNQSAAQQGVSSQQFQNYLNGQNTSPAPGGGSVMGASTGGSPGSSRLDFVTSLMDQFKSDEVARQAKSQEARDKLVKFYEGLEDPTSRFMKFREEQGLPQQEELVNALTKNIMSNQDLIEGLEDDVTNRSKDFLIDDTGRLSLLGRERAPLEKNLNQLLRNKQYEEIGLAGKQNLVSQLLELSFKNDQMRAEPLRLGVDFTKEDAQIARDIFFKMADRSTSAYDEDMDSKESRAKEDRDRVFQSMLKDQEFERQKQMESIRSTNSIKEYNATTGAKTTAETQKKQAEQQANDIYTKLLGSKGSETEIWKYLMDNRDRFSKLGIMDELWRLHGSFKAKLNSSNLTDNSF